MTSPFDAQLACCRSVSDADDDEFYYSAIDVWKVLADIFTLAKTKHRDFLRSASGKSIIRAFAEKHGPSLAIRSVVGAHANWYHRSFCHDLFEHFDAKHCNGYARWTNTRTITSAANDDVGADGSVVVIGDKTTDTALYEGQIDVLEAKVNDLSAALQDRDVSLAQRDAAIVRFESDVAERDASLASLKTELENLQGVSAQYKRLAHEVEWPTTSLASRSRIRSKALPPAPTNNEPWLPFDNSLTKNQLGWIEWSDHMFEPSPILRGPLMIGSFVEHGPPSDRGMLFSYLRVEGYLPDYRGERSVLEDESYVLSDIGRMFDKLRRAPTYKCALLTENRSAQYRFIVRMCRDNGIATHFVRITDEVLQRTEDDDDIEVSVMEERAHRSSRSSKRR